MIPTRFWVKIRKIFFSGVTDSRILALHTCGVWHNRIRFQSIILMMWTIVTRWYALHVNLVIIPSAHMVLLIPVQDKINNRKLIKETFSQLKGYQYITSTWLLLSGYIALGVEITFQETCAVVEQYVLTTQVVIYHTSIKCLCWNPNS